MFHIIVGTNRPQSRSAKVAHIIQKLYQNENTEAKIIDISTLPMSELDGSQYASNQPLAITAAVQEITASQGLIMITPEYNGGFPGILKYFIDHWKYPDTFEYRPVCFIGIGGRFGGLRPVEHLQQVFGYRNAFVFPDRVFLSNIWSILVEDRITDEMAEELLKRQTRNFITFVEALESAKLAANQHMQLSSKN